MDDPLPDPVGLTSPPPHIRSTPAPEEEEDVCRVCRSEGEPGNPLMYPCKCSGSVRFVHPDCLQDWLKHSGKRYCEICGHSYTFSKVYENHIPAYIPTRVYVRQGIRLLVKILLKIIRGVLVICAWLIWLPASNLLTLRTNLWFTDLVIKDFISSPPSGNSSVLGTDNTTIIDVIQNATEAAQQAANATRPLTEAQAHGFFYALFHPIEHSSSWLSRWMLRDENAMPGFIFRGQILSITLAAVIIGFILLREWMQGHERGLLDNVPQNLPNADGTITDEKDDLDPEKWVFAGGVAQRKVDQTATESTAESATAAAEHLLALLNHVNDIPQPELKAIVKDVENDLKIGADQKEDDDEVENDHPTAGTRNVFYRPPTPYARPSPPREPPTVRQAIALAQNPDPGSDNREEGLMDILRVNIPSADQLGDVLKRVQDVQVGRQQVDLETSGPVGSHTNALASGSGSSSNPRVLAQTAQKAEIGLSYVAPELLNSGGRESPVDNGSSVESSDRKGKRKAEMPLDEDADWPRSRDQPRPATPSPERDSRETSAFSRETTVDNLGEVGGREEEGDWEPDDGDGSGDGEIQEIPDRPEERDDGGGLGGRRRDRFRDDERFGGRHGRDEMDVVFEDEEGDAWQGDELDAIMEAVGLRGPIVGLASNVLIGVFVMSASIALLIGLPLFIGKFVLSIDIIRTLLFTLQSVTNLLRKLTDPIIDVILDMGKHVILLPALTSLRAVGRIVGGRILGGLPFLGTLLGRDTASTPLMESEILSLPGQGVGITFFGIDIIEKLGNVLEFVGAEAYELYEIYRGYCNTLVGSSKTVHRVLCIIIGDMVAIATIVGYALLGEDRWSGDIVASAKQHAMFVKLTIFMALELLFFPLVIGCVMDVLMLPLFPGATISGHIEMVQRYPFGGLFVAWLIGTIFMFAFAGLLSQIRQLCRPGALFFIRDPADNNYSPVKDILERPAVSQMRKLCISAVMYSVVVFWLFGATIWSMKYQPFGKVLPLRFGHFEPLTSVPFDILFIHLVLPSSLEALHPRHRSKKALSLWWRATTRGFRLTSLIYGTENAAINERTLPTTPLEKSLWPILDTIHQLAFGRYDPTETEARVPHVDSILLLSPAERKTGGVFIPLTTEGAPKTDNDAVRLLKQDRVARKAGRNPKTEYTVVWLPQFWRTRVHVFILCALITGGCVIGCGFFGPLLVGRMALGLVFEKPVHDGYSLLAGGHIIWLSLASGLTVQKAIITYDRASRLRRSQPSRVLKRYIMNFLSGLYAVFVMYLVVPGLLGVCWELYIGVWGRYGFVGASTVINVWDAWSIGVVINSILVGALNIMIRRTPTLHDHATKLREIRNLFQQPLNQNFKKVNNFFIPAGGIALGLILLPWVVSLFLAGVAHVIGKSIPSLTFRLIFPSLLLMFVITMLSRYLLSKTDDYKQYVIDEEYVIEEKVENYGSPPAGLVLVGGKSRVPGGGEGGEMEEEWEDVDVR